MNVCIIDIGSNTIKASVYKIFGKNTKKEIAYKGSKEKLITYINSENEMALEGIIKLDKSIGALKEFAEEYDCEKIFAFATASLRGVKNSDEIVALIENKYSLSIDILTAEEEALCSLKGLLSDAETNLERNGIMIDMGGGSTEIVKFENGELPLIESLNFGCLSLGGDDIIKTDAFNIIDEELKKCAFAKNANYPLFLVGGTARAILSLSNARQNLKTSRLKSDGSDFLYLVNNMQNEEILDFVKKTVPSRAKTVFSGAFAYLQLVNFIKPTSITVSDSGVRDGYLERILP